MHVLVFASHEAMRCMSLPETVMATMPDAIDAEDVLPGAVQGSQLDRGRRSGWPIHEGKSQWKVADTGLQLQLRHARARPRTKAKARAAVPPGLPVRR